MPSPASTTVPWEIECREVKALLDGGQPFLLLDCREADEHAQVRIDKARLLPMSEMVDRLQEIEPFREAPVVVYCHHGGRSLRVTQWLRQSGFANVRSMSGGIDRWAEEIEPGMIRY